MGVVRCLPTVRFGGFAPALCVILSALVDVARDIDEPAEVIITAGSNGVHSHYSRHYTFEAIDVRTHNFTGERAVREFAARLAAKLPAGAFTVLLEDEGQANEHLHIQPVKGSVYP